jgi:hypothetical protein
MKLAVTVGPSGAGAAASDQFAGGAGGGAGITGGQGSNPTN